MDMWRLRGAYGAILITSEKLPYETIGVIKGIYRVIHLGYIRILEKKMEATIWVVVKMTVPFWVP